MSGVKRFGVRGTLVILCLGCFVALKAQVAEGLDAEKKRQPGMISNEEYRAGMDQKRLEIIDPEKALREDLWRPCAALAVGDGYSVLLQFRQAHPMVAEYQRRVMVFSGDDRRGGLSGALQLRMNFGGRTYLLVYRHLDAAGKVTHVTFEPRDEAITGVGQSIRLKDPDFERPPDATRKEYLGLISGEAYPLKFVPPLVVSEAMAREKLDRCGKRK